jgi:hypothetical protein
MRGRKQFGNRGDGVAGDGVRFDHSFRSPAGVPVGNERLWVSGSAQWNSVMVAG